MFRYSLFYHMAFRSFWTKQTGKILSSHVEPLSERTDYIDYPLKNQDALGSSKVLIHGDLSCDYYTEDNGKLQSLAIGLSLILLLRHITVSR